MKTIIVLILMFSCNVAWGIPCMKEGCLVYHAEGIGSHVLPFKPDKH